MKRWIGSKEFYKRVLIIGLPIVFQQLFLTTFGIVDTIMVGSIYRGVAGVGIAAQLEQIVFTIVFGINVGIGLYLAQFFGAEDEENMKNTFALGIGIVLGFTILATVIVFFFRVPIIHIFNQDPVVVEQATNYIAIALFAYIPGCMSFVYSIAYRNIQRTKVPMIISIVTMLINVSFNYFLIFGIGPFPELGVQGAAIATVLSSSIGLVCNVGYSLITKQPFVPKLKNFIACIHPSFFFRVIRRMIPFIVNEALFSVGTALYVVFINKLGSDAYEGYRVAETIVSVMFVVSFGVSTAVSAMIGQELGRKKLEKASAYGDYFIFIGLIVALVLSVLNALLARPLVSLFPVDIPSVIENAVRVMYVSSLRLFLRVFVIIIFSTFRAGGEARYVMFLDAGLVWLIGIPIAFLLTNYFSVQDVALFYLLMQIEPLIRVIIGMRHFLKKTWIRNLTDEIVKPLSVEV